MTDDRFMVFAHNFDGVPVKVYVKDILKYYRDVGFKTSDDGGKTLNEFTRRKAENVRKRFRA